MGEQADQERTAVEALRSYRDALARAEALEKEEAVARRALADWLRGLEQPKNKGGPLNRREATQQGQSAISKLNETRLALSNATATLDAAYHALVALDGGLDFLRGDASLKKAGDVQG